MRPERQRRTVAKATSPGARWVIAPFAAGHLAAIKLEQLVELAAAEENAPVPAVIGEAGNRRHDPSLPYFPC